jgi:hypothetical protein
MALLDSDDYGNLFGGAGNSFLAPFVGQQGMGAAEDNSLLNMGAAMMQAGARSFDPSHSSFLNALGAGLGAGQQAYQGSMQRGLANAGAAMNLAQNKAFFDIARGATPGGSSSIPGGSSGPAYSPGTQMFSMPGSVPSGNGAGGGTAPTTSSTPAGNGAGGSAETDTSNDPLAPGGSLNPLGMPRAQAALSLLGDRQKYLEANMAAYSPTDLMKTLRANGITPGTPAWNQAMTAATAKATAPEVSRLAGSGAMVNGQYVNTPGAVPEGFTAIQDPTNPAGYKYVPIPGGTEAVAAASTARAAGPATFKTVQTYNPVTKQMEATPQTVNAQNAGAYNPSPNSNMPAPLRNNNPGALMTGPGGTLGSYPTMQAGMSAMDGNLQNYGKRGINTVNDIVSTWSPANGKGNSAANTQAYVADVAQQLGVDPSAPLNMADPATRQALAVAMVNHENGRAAAAASGVEAGGPPAAGGAPHGLPTSAPLGTPERERAAQEAASTNMQKDRQIDQDFARTGPQQLQALQRMQQIAQGKTIFSTGPLGDTEAAQDNPLNAAPAEFEKQRSNYLTLAGATGTDAQRAQAAHSVPDYGKPKAAILDGINTQIQQTQQRMLRGQFLTPAFNSGDATTYTKQANDFDNHILPSMMPALTLSGPAQRAAVQQILKANPALKSNFQWALDNGMLK